MRQLTTQAIILSRTDYGEADRILTLLTPQYGKLSLLAKGVRRVKSKLAGGIELFSISEITFIQGRGTVGTLISARLVKHYSRIVGDLGRTMTGYELIKQLHKATEDEPEGHYFDLLCDTFEALNDPAVTIEVIRFWFSTQLLRLGGHTLNLQTDSRGDKLAAEQLYDFDFEHMAFIAAPGRGQFTASHIKLLRLTFSAHAPQVLSQIQGGAALIAACMPLVHTISQRV